MRKVDDHHYELSSGKKIYAHGGIVGINSELEVHDGYDGHFGRLFEASYDFDEEEEARRLTEQEHDEICDFMIDLWQQRKADKRWCKKGGL